MIKKSGNNTNNSKGTTIVELLIYLALLSVFLTVLLDVFVTTLGFKLQSESTSTLNQDTRYIFEKISYDIYNADSFTVPTSGELDFVYGGQINRYTVNGGDLLRNSVKLNSLDTKVQSISYTKIDDTVKVVLTLESEINLPGGVRTQSVETTLAPR
jgi:hypothetical protein